MYILKSIMYEEKWKDVRRERKCFLMAQYIKYSLRGDWFNHYFLV